MAVPDMTFALALQGVSVILAAAAAAALSGGAAALKYETIIDIASLKWDWHEGVARAFVSMRNGSRVGLALLALSLVAQLASIAVSGIGTMAAASVASLILLVVAFTVIALRLGVVLTTRLNNRDMGKIEKMRPEPENTPEEDLAMDGEVPRHP